MSGDVAADTHPPPRKQRRVQRARRQNSDSLSEVSDILPGAVLTSDAPGLLNAAEESALQQLTHNANALAAAAIGDAAIGAAALGAGPPKLSAFTASALQASECAACEATSGCLCASVPLGLPGAIVYSRGVAPNAAECSYARRMSSCTGRCCSVRAPETGDRCCGWPPRMLSAGLAIGARGASLCQLLCSYVALVQCYLGEILCLRCT